MHVERYERYWMWAATGMLVLFLGAIVVTAVAGSAHPAEPHRDRRSRRRWSPWRVRRRPGVIAAPTAAVTVVMRAEFYVFRPGVVRVPAGRRSASASPALTCCTASRSSARTSTSPSHPGM